MLNIRNGHDNIWPALLAVVAIVCLGLAVLRALDWVAPASAQEGEGIAYGHSLRTQIEGDVVHLEWKAPTVDFGDSKVTYEVQRLGETIGAITFVRDLTPTEITDQPSSHYYCQKITYILATRVDGELQESQNSAATPGQFNPEGLDCPEPEPAEEPVTEVESKPEPPDHVLCFYVEDDVIKSVRARECTINEVKRQWSKMNDQPEPIAEVGSSTTETERSAVEPAAAPPADQ